MNLRKPRKGFTLIEILIVIVILAVLASLILPRMLAQPERALVAEAINYLGVIRHTQESMVGIVQADWITGAATAGTDGDDGWKDMGMGPVSGASSFDYSCVGGDYDSPGLAEGDDGTCTATRREGIKANGTITMSLNTGRITECSGSGGGNPYVLIGSGSGATCR